jgi:dTDP-glucose pyrophosphorylase
MINVLVPMAGKSLFFSENDYPFPKPLIEIGSMTMIEHVIGNLCTLAPVVQFIFVLSNTDCRKFHLDSTLNIITNHQCKIIRLDSETKGAACSALMAIDHIANEHPLVIANSDQIFTTSMPALLERVSDADAGVATFESVHPRWSYVKLDDRNRILETAEKHPISRHAIAGFYHFRKGIYFVNAAMSMIQKDSNINGSFYIAPVLNELILDGKTVLATSLKSGDYHTFYTPQKIKEYEIFLTEKFVRYN